VPRSQTCTVDAIRSRFFGPGRGECVHPYGRGRRRQFRGDGRVRRLKDAPAAPTGCCITRMRANHVRHNRPSSAVSSCDQADPPVTRWRREKSLKLLFGPAKRTALCGRQLETWPSGGTPQCRLRCPQDGCEIGQRQERVLVRTRCAHKRLGVRRCQLEPLDLPATQQRSLLPKLFLVLVPTGLPLLEKPFEEMTTKTEMRIDRWQRRPITDADSL
jgi:hypothetical protein